MNNDIMAKKKKGKQVEQPFVEHQKKIYSTFKFIYLHLFYL
jgi:hypothetical protein